MFWRNGDYETELIKDLITLSRLVITEDTILTIDADKAKVKSSFGGGMFYMPHGLEIDKEGNTWVTDAGLHQVMKFEKGQTKPSLGSFRNFDLEILKMTFAVLGEKFVPGSDGDHFCKPTSVAVATNGMVFVGDGSVLYRGQGQSSVAKATLGSRTMVNPSIN